MPQTSDFLEKLALFFLYNFHRERSLQKLKIKKLLQKINVKDIKKSFFYCWFFQSTAFSLWKWHFCLTGNFCCLLITHTSRLDPDYGQPVLTLIKTVCYPDGILKYLFRKSWFEKKKKNTRRQKHVILPSMRLEDRSSLDRCSNDFCRLLIILAIRLDPDQDGQSVLIKIQTDWYSDGTTDFVNK